MFAKRVMSETSYERSELRAKRVTSEASYERSKLRAKSSYERSELRAKRVKICGIILIYVYHFMYITLWLSFIYWSCFWSHFKVVRGAFLSKKQCWCKLNKNSCTYSDIRSIMCKIFKKIDIVQF